MAFHTALGRDVNWLKACDQAVSQLAGIESDLGLVYLSDHFTEVSDKILHYLSNHLPVKNWVGSVGSALIIDTLEIYDAPAIALMVTDIPARHFCLTPNFTELPLGTKTCADTDKTASSEPGFGVIHGDPMNPQMPELIDALSERLGGVWLTGGLSSAEENFQQITGKIHNNGLSGVVFDQHVKVSTGLSQGCSLLGNSHEITRSQDNLVIEIDNRPALEILKHAVGDILSHDLSRIGGFIFAAFPVEGADTDDYLVRNIIGLGAEEGVIAVGDIVHEGQRIQFAKRDTQTARDDLTRMTEHVLALAGNKVKGALYISCLGRGRYQFGDDNEEIRLVQKALGDVPLIGFYANGEIAHNRLYGYTGVLTLFHS